jgi:hypothetical protein
MMNDGTTTTATKGQDMKSYKAIHMGDTYSGTESKCKEWARQRENAQVINPNGFVRFVSRYGKLIKV